MKKILRIFIIILVVICTFSINKVWANTSIKSTDEKIKMIKKECGTDEIDIVEFSKEELLDKEKIEIKPKIPNGLEVIPHYSLRSIFGPDSRTRVQNASAFPYSAIAHVSSGFYGIPPTEGTAFLIAENVALTAAHNIYLPGYGYTTGITVTPGKTGAIEPFGSATAIATYIPSEYPMSQDYTNDWGIIVLDSNIGASAGNLGVRAYTNAYGELASKTVKLTGYPGIVNGSEVNDEQWETTGNIMTAWDEYLCHELDCSKGQSGAPIYELDNYAVAIHHFGGSMLNFATNTTEEIIAMCIEYIEQYN